MAFSTSIKNSMIILLAAPVMIQAVLMIAIFDLHNRSEAAREEAETCRAVSDEVNVFYEDLMHLLDLSGGEYSFGQSFFDERIISAERKIKVTLDTLRELVDKDPLRGSSIDKLEYDLKQFHYNLAELKKGYVIWGDTDDGRAKRSPYWQKLYAIAYHEAPNDIADFTKQQKEIADLTVKRRTEFNEKIAQTALLSSGVLVGLVVLAIIAVLRRIDRRFKIMQDNSYRLASDLPLNEPLSGRDELAEMDATFHVMANALKQATLKERAIIENARDIICSLGKDLRFQSANKALGDFLHIEPKDIVNEPLTRFVDEIDMDIVHAYFEKARAGKHSQPLELKVRKKTGEEFYTIWSVAWFPDLESYFCVVHDITERKNLEEMRQEMVRMVTHDIRSPLSTVQAMISFFISGQLGELNERGERMVKHAEVSSNRIMALVNDFLDSERLESGNFPMDFQPTEASIIVADSIASVVGLAEKKQVKLLSEPSDLLVQCDKDRMVQVVVNLLANAVKFSPEGKTVTVSVVAVDDSAEFRITDQGRGIPADQTELIFEKFKQVATSDARNMGGTGLGLNICKSIVQLHGGSIGVDSELSHGSTFWFRIPLAEQA